MKQNQPIKSIYIGEDNNPLWERSESLAKQSGFRSRSELIVKLLERFEIRKREHIVSTEEKA